MNGLERITVVEIKNGKPVTYLAWQPKRHHGAARREAHLTTLRRRLQR